MTTVSSWLALLAAVLFVAGFLISVRQRRSRTQILGVIATVAATFVTGWLAWYSSIQV